MLTQDDLQSIEKLIKVSEGRTGKKLKNMEDRLQDSINRTVDVFDAEITELKEKTVLIEKHLGFSAV